MVKSYLRYEPAASFGVICSLEGNITYDNSGRYLLSPALEKIAVWHVRQGTCVKTLVPSSFTSISGPSRAVTALACASSSLVASGYADGCIRLWDIDTGECGSTFNGHSGAVSALRFDATGALLASGSKDNDIILWDVVGETGRFRLRGHRDQVTDVVFIDSGRKLVSSSKDKFLRVWDLETPHCMQIVSGHHSEIWSLAVDPEERYLVSGSSDRELRIYTMKHDISVAEMITTDDPQEAPTQSKWEILKIFGEIVRQGKDRVATMRFNKVGNLLACQVAGKTVEFYKVLGVDEAARKAKRRLQRKEKKLEKMEKTVIHSTVAEVNNPLITVADVFKLGHFIRTSKKICSVTFSPINSKNFLASIALSLNNNQLEFYNIDEESAAKNLSIELQGHRSDIRSLSLSSDNTLLMSTSHNFIKIWNPSTCSCLRTIDSGFGLCGLILQHNKYALVGTKEGIIEVVDIGSGTIVEKIEAHGGSLDTIAHIPNENGFVTGSADKDVKFWEFHTELNEKEGTKHLVVSNVKTLKMNDDVLAVAISPDSKYIAVALLDNTVKVHFMDSLKIFLSLYGHNQPVLCMDISSDGDLIATGSMDKNMKIWGLDFGDCHKSLFAHSDSVTAVKFVRNTHYLFSAGKDRHVKYWDADKFELLLVLEGHHDSIWCLAVSSLGDFVVTGSHDRSIRRWDRTDEPFFLEEEKEKRVEEMFENHADLFGSSNTMKDQIPEEGAVAVAGKKCRDTLTATDLIIDALDVADAELRRIADYEDQSKTGRTTEFQPNIMLGGLRPSDYVLKTISNIPTNNLEQSLLALPFSDALKLLSFLKEWTCNYDKVERVCRVAAFIVQIHYNQLITSPAARPILIALQDVLPARVKECKDTIGFNLAAMNHIKQMLAMSSDAPFKDAKAKLLEIREQLSKQVDGRMDTKVEKRKKKKQKKTEDGHSHAWS